MTVLTPSMVKEVSAMFVETITRGVALGSTALFCISGLSEP
jgi:hypothetical protein